MNCWFNILQPRSMTGILFVTMHSPKAVYPNTNDQGHGQYNERVTGMRNAEYKQDRDTAI